MDPRGFYAPLVVDESHLPRVVTAEEAIAARARNPG